MKQTTLASVDFEVFRKATRKEEFLTKMDATVPWAELCARIELFYPKPQGAGRPPIGLERMLRIYLLQHWFQLSDPGVEDELHDSRAARRFVGIDLGSEPVPDETTVLKFRHLLEKNELGAEVFRCVNAYLEANGIKVSRGTIVDATILQAPSSTKNREKERDPEMHSTRKGEQCYFGMKAHVGVDSDTKLIHSVASTSAEVHDSQVLEGLLHGEETRVWGDSAYAGKRDVMVRAAPSAKDFTQKRPYKNRPLTKAERQRNRTKSRVRARVEHVFQIMKCQFGFWKVRYRGLRKNTNHLFVTCALVNLVLALRLRPSLARG